MFDHVIRRDRPEHNGRIRKPKPPPPCQPSACVPEYVGEFATLAGVSTRCQKCGRALEMAWERIARHRYEDLADIEAGLIPGGVP